MSRGGDKRRRPFASASLAVVLLATACGGEPDPPQTTLGMTVGSGFFDLAAFEAFEAELGTELRYTVQFTGRVSQKNMNSTVFGLLASEEAALPEVSDRLSLVLSVPLGFGQADARSNEGRDEIARSLQAIADGEHDAAYRRVARRLVEAGFGDATIRLGHEFNGAWPPWSSRNNEEVYKAAYRHVHAVLKEESSGFRFDWTATRIGWDDWVVQAYPGDDVVDVIGLDVFWKVREGDSPWSTDVWERDFLPVLRNHLNFAREHDKSVSYPEWGVAGADNPAFIEAMHEWLSSLPESGPGRLEYQSYFNSGPEFDFDNYPNSEAAYIRLFGQT